VTEQDTETTTQGQFKTQRYPDLGHQIDEAMAVAIDGEIYQDV